MNETKINENLYFPLGIAGGGGGGEAVLIDKSISANGTYNASTDNADGYKKVVVDVQPDLTTKNITENGTYNASADNADGYSSVTVALPLGTKSITSNGDYSASADSLQGFSSVTVNVPDTAQALINQTISGTVVVPEGVTILRRNLFEFCSQITAVNLPSTLTQINDYCFHGCNSLTNVSLPNSLTILGSFTFNGSGLTSFDSNNVTVINGATFQGSLFLTNVKLRNGITIIHATAFSGCVRMVEFDLTEFTVTNGNVDTALANVNAFTNTGTATFLFATQEIMQAYAQATNWASYANRMTYVGA